VVRQFCRDLSLPVPTESQLDEALEALLTERADAEPLAAWPGVRIRRYRGYLWCFTDVADPGGDPLAGDDFLWDGSDRLELGGVRGSLSLSRQPGPGIDPGVLGRAIQVRFRSGGEQIRPAGGASLRQFKKLLQEEGVLPWMRGHIPLLYLDEQLLAAGDQWLNFDHPAVIAEEGLQVVWQPECAWRNPFNAD